MKVITLWRPWGAAIITGLKTIETRGHPRFASLVGKTIGIHNAARWHAEGVEIMRRYVPADPLHLFERSHPFNLSKAIIGTVEVVNHEACIYLKLDVEEYALCPIEDGMYGLILQNPIPYSYPIEVPGAMGIWNYPREVKV